jgi:hypothetical protein
MLALERKATLLKPGPQPEVRVRAQPFGGAIRFRDPSPLFELIGDIRFDNQRSQDEGDFRILIQPSDWPAVKEFCLRHLDHPEDPVLEATPDRELVEEFYDSLGIRLTPDQYATQPLSTLIENHPVRTENIHASGYPTARIYRVYEVRILDATLVQAMIENSVRFSDSDLRQLVLQNANNGGPGRMNAILALPLGWLTDRYLALPRQKRTQVQEIEGHLLDSNVPAILAGVQISKYQIVTS